VQPRNACVNSSKTALYKIYFLAIATSFEDPFLLRDILPGHSKAYSRMIR